MSTGSFVYRALDRSGKEIRGKVAASTGDEARDVLLGRGLLPIEVYAGGSVSRQRKSMPTADLAVGLRILADLFDAGLPVSRALTAFDKMAPKSWQSVTPSLRSAVRDGKSLATALSEAPVKIPDLVIGMAKAGEAGDGIANALQRAAMHTEAAAATQAALRSALAYPIVVGLAGFTSLIVMVGVVLPRFALILADIGQSLPRSTTAVLGVVAIAKHALLPCLVIAATGSIVFAERMRSKDGRRRIHAALLGIPILGSVRWSAATARITASLAALLASGVPVHSALATAARAGDDKEIESRIDSARKRIRDGSSISAAMSEAQAITPVAVRLIRAGEESGRLVSMLDRVADMERTRVSRIVGVAVRTLEPTLILIFALLVGIVAIALLQAVYAVRPI